MKRILRLLPWTLVLALWTVPQDTWAQSGAAGQVELGSFGTFTKYEDIGGAGLDQEFGAGGRLGFFFSRVFALEASGDYTRTRLATGEQVNVTRLLIHTRWQAPNAILVVGDDPFTIRELWQGVVR